MSIENISQIILEDTFNPDDYLVPVLPKEKDSRGFIYIVVDTKYPELLKVGKTQDFVKRVKTYNVDRPYEDVNPILCTRMIKNVDYVEAFIKSEISRAYSSVGKSKEWFPRKCLKDILEILENTFDHQYVTFGDFDHEI